MIFVSVLQIMKLTLKDKSRQACPSHPELGTGHSEEGLKGNLFPEETNNLFIKTFYQCINQEGHINLIYFKSIPWKSDNLWVLIQN